MLKISRRPEYLQSSDFGEYIDINLTLEKKNLALVYFGTVLLQIRMDFPFKPPLELGIRYGAEDQPVPFENHNECL